MKHEIKGGAGPRIENGGSKMAGAVIVFVVSETLLGN